MTVTPPPLPAGGEAGSLLDRVHPGRAVALAAAVLFTARYVRNPGSWTLLDDVNLAVHEAGHVLFSPFGEFLMMLGGSVLQLIVPALFVGYFIRARQPFAAAIVLFWVAVNLFNVSVYIGDARARELPLITGDPTTHDWTWLLIRMDLLGSDTRIADFVRRIGVVTFLAATVLGGRFTLRAPAAADEEPARAGV
jgi:hypothetical protein